MHDIIEKTGPYLHPADDAYRICFETGGTPRAFTILIARARDGLTIEDGKNGVAIIDDDSLQVVLDEHMRNDLSGARREVARIRSMNWGAFSDFCREHPRYRKTSPDISEARKVPYPGSRVNQERRGYTPVNAGTRDIRSMLMISADIDASCPYSFPPVTKAEAARDLLRSTTRRCEDGMYRLSWDIRMGGVASMDPRKWGADHISDPAIDEDWADYVSEYPEIFHEVCADMIHPYLSQQIGTWGAQDEGRYSFSVEGLSGGNLLLTHIDGQDLGFKTNGAFGVFVEHLDDGDLRDIWKLKHTLDHDLAEKSRLTLFHQKMATIRSSYVRPELEDADNLMLH